MGETKKTDSRLSDSERSQARLKPSQRRWLFYGGCAVIAMLLLAGIVLGLGLLQTSGQERGAAEKEEAPPRHIKFHATKDPRKTSKAPMPETETDTASVPEEKAVTVTVSEDETWIATTTEEETMTATVFKKRMGIASVSEEETMSAMVSKEESMTTTVSEEERGTASVSEEETMSAMASKEETVTAMVFKKKTGTASVSEEEAMSATASKEEKGTATGTPPHAMKMTGKVASSDEKAKFMSHKMTTVVEKPSTTASKIPSKSNRSHVLYAKHLTALEGNIPGQ
ncbi:mucin-22-like [Dermacentor albipictus]|uniref:mucin-22-like n=1 Tax=Dermacentor albipictus TaxID=60249 RepID=UPI0031FDC664